MIIKNFELTIKIFNLIINKINNFIPNYLLLKFYLVNLHIKILN